MRMRGSRSARSGSGRSTERGGDAPLTKVDLALDPAGRERALKKSLGTLDADVASRLVTATADIALILDSGGVIREVSIANEDLAREGCDRWVGKAWLDVVTTESRPKIIELLRDANAKAVPRWRQINHPSPSGVDLPVRYAAVQLGQSGRIIALGRELRAMAGMQQRLVEAQQSMEREYARLRHTETRYRILFQMTSEPVLIADASSLKIIEANPATTKLIGKPVKKIIGRTLSDVFDAGSNDALQSIVATLRAAGEVNDVRLRLAERRIDIMISASMFRQQNAANILLRLLPVGSATAERTRGPNQIQRVVESMPDGFVLIGADQRVLAANTAFLDMAQIASDEQLRGESLSHWLGRSEVDFDVLMSNLREHGSIRQFSTILRGQFDTIEDVDVSAVAILSGDQPCFGLTLRPAMRRGGSGSDALGGRELPRSAKQLTELVGRVPLKNLVRESTDLIEKLCIEAALDLVDNNRASAAEMLGLSRQGLYVKLRRYGLVDTSSDE